MIANRIDVLEVRTVFYINITNDHIFYY